MSGVVGPCVASECEAVVDLWVRCALTRPWNDPRRDFDLAVATPSSAVLAGRDEGRIVAAVMVGFDGHRGWAYYLGVDPARRGCGWGRRMMEAAETWTRDRGAAKLQLMVRDDNAAAAGFYRRLDFEVQPVVVLGKRLA